MNVSVSGVSWVKGYGQQGQGHERTLRDPCRLRHWYRRFRKDGSSTTFLITIAAAHARDCVCLTGQGRGLRPHKVTVRRL